MLIDKNTILTVKKQNIMDIRLKNIIPATIGDYAIYISIFKETKFMFYNDYNITPISCSNSRLTKNNIKNSQFICKISSNSENKKNCYKKIFHYLDMKSDYPYEEGDVIMYILLSNVKHFNLIIEPAILKRCDI